MLAGLITTAIDSVVSEAQLQCIQTGRLSSDALSNVVVRNRLQMGDVFAGLDRVWGSDERSHKLLSEFCNAPPSGRVECWEQYIGQYGLAYELMPEEDPHLEFLSFPVESELEGTMTKFVYFQTVLRHPSFILRAGTQSYTLYYWCHVLDINQQTALRHQGLEICSEADSCCKKLEQEIDGILGTLGPGVSRWLQLNFLNPDRRLDWVCRSSRHASEEMLKSFLHLEKDPSPAMMREVREALKFKLKR